MPNNTDTTKNKKNNNVGQRGRQGFASMDDKKQRQIASKGGKNQGKKNNPGNFANDPERAREAGRKGGRSK
ncbi:MAG: KGG domain-containing protein [Patescibacteria group bacterium]